ncbi:MAG TPA: P-loop NTPase [Firmicutes bacterium]|nr:P-loop NTPase [Bacillota bacterium]
MKIAIASGKGGTGKTLVATNLAVVAARAGNPVHLLDCDVEEPNVHIFLRPGAAHEREVAIANPVVSDELCTGCGECAQVCQFNALAVVRDRVLFFPELCHGCAACWTLCPEGVITEGRRPIGRVTGGDTGISGLRVTYGILHPGEALAPPIINQVKSMAGEGVTLIDAPPGTACPAVEAVRGSDFCLLVTEPTPFGRHDLELAVEMTRALDVPVGAVINRADVGERAVWDFCWRENIPVLLEIPFSRQMAELYAGGQLAALASDEWRAVFTRLWHRLREVAA